MKNKSSTICNISGSLMEVRLKLQAMSKSELEL